MEKGERRERAKAALACMELAAKCVSQALAESTDGTITSADYNKAHDVIGRIQIRLSKELEKARGGKS